MTKQETRDVAFVSDADKTSKSMCWCCRKASPRKSLTICSWPSTAPRATAGNSSTIPAPNATRPATRPLPTT